MCVPTLARTRCIVEVWALRAHHKNKIGNAVPMRARRKRTLTPVHININLFFIRYNTRHNTNPLQSTKYCLRVSLIFLKKTFKKVTYAWKSRTTVEFL